MVDVTSPSNKKLEERSKRYYGSNSVVLMKEASKAFQKSRSAGKLAYRKNIDCLL